MRYRDANNDDCAIAQALGVVGDWWTLLIVRDIAGGVCRFDALQRELGISRKVLTERLRELVANGVVTTRSYSAHPPRHEYLLTDAGRGLLPVLIALQNWGDRFVLGDGALSATATAGSVEARRAHALVGTTVPSLTLPMSDGRHADAVAASGWTVLYAFPGAYAPSDNGYPPGWSAIPGAKGCTLEARTYRDNQDRFRAHGVTVHGVSTQRVDELANFAAHEALSFPLFSDADGTLATALRLPVFRASGVDRLKRLTLVIDRDRTIRNVQYPVPHPAESAEDVLTFLCDLEAAS
jgi:DNA-binding HxlR family transcriptional regulator/peroxiredoxin